jgi:hypothetical protein
MATMATICWASTSAVSREAQLLDGAVAHPLGDDGAGDQVAAVLGEDDAPGDGADPVAGPPHPLQPGGDARRRLDLDHEVDQSHVDAEFEARGGDHRGELPRFQRLLDVLALLAGDAAVMRPGHHGWGARGRPGLGHDLRGEAAGPPGGDRVVPAGRRRRPGGAVGGQLVEAGAEPLGTPAAVGEHDGRPVGPDQVEDALLDRRPDRRRGGVLPVTAVAGVGHVLDRHLDRHLDHLRGGRRDDLDRGRAAEEPRGLGDRPDRRGEPDPLGGSGQQRVEPLERQGEVRPPFAGADGVHLVDDDRVDGGQRLPCGRGEQQKQRLRRRYQDVGRGAGERPPLGGGRVPGPHADRHCGWGQALAGRGLTQAGQRRPEVALDVDGERLERADVEHPAAPPAVRSGRGGLGGQPVERPEKRREGLARACGGDHERVAPRADRPPRAGLGLGRRRERRAEPRTGGWREKRQHVAGRHATILPRGCDDNGGSGVVSGGNRRKAGNYLRPTTNSG